MEVGQTTHDHDHRMTASSTDGNGTRIYPSIGANSIGITDSVLNLQEKLFWSSRLTL